MHNAFSRISHWLGPTNEDKKAISNIAMESMKNTMSQRDDFILRYFRSVSVFEVLFACNAAITIVRLEQYRLPL